MTKGERIMPIEVLVRGPQGGGKTHLIEKIEDMLRNDTNYSAEIYCADGFLRSLGDGPTRIVIREMQ